MSPTAAQRTLRKFRAQAEMRLGSPFRTLLLFLLDERDDSVNRHLLDRIQLVELRYPRTPTWQRALTWLVRKSSETLFLTSRVRSAATQLTSTSPLCLPAPTQLALALRLQPQLVVDPLITIKGAHREKSLRYCHFPTLKGEISHTDVEGRTLMP